ncbi:MAG: glycosyltransferase family A protein, partial [Planctomycetaceae bacterium]
MTSPCVSVVMSVYNNATTVGYAVDSILAQSFSDFELIVIDDGSKDGSGKVLADRADRDPRVIVVSQENAGLTRALIRGCELARGRYIARQDADDWSHAERLFEQVAVLNAQPEVGFVSCWSECCGPRGELVDVIMWPAGSDDATNLFRSKPGGLIHGSVMFRRELYEEVGSYRSEFFFAQDCDLWMRLIEHSSVAFVQRALYVFRSFGPRDISGSHGSQQNQFFGLGLACRHARLQNGSDKQILNDVRKLKECVLKGSSNS